MKTARRGIAGFAAAALTATGLSVLGVATAPAAHAEEVSIDSAVLRWGVSNEANNAAFAPGTWNLFSAGKVGDPGAGGETLKTADQGATWSNDAAAGWTSQSGNVTVEDLQAGGTYAPTTFDGTRQDATGASTSPPSSNVFAQTQLVFRKGIGTVDVAANTASIQWDGDATVLFYSGMSFFYVSDPELTVNADGTGAVTATVDGYASDMNDVETWTDLAAEEVTLATLSDVDVEDLGFTTTPDYLGVEYDAPAGATAQARTGAHWGAFPHSFVDFAQRTGAGSYWYSSGGSADPKKPATPLEVSWTEPPTVTVSQATLTADGTHQVTVTGTGFDPAAATGTRPPLSGKAGGAYIVFAKFPDAWRPSAGVPSAQRKVAAQKWAVLAGDMTTIGGAGAGAVELTPEGTFSTTITVDKAAADTAAASVATATRYGIYTYPGSGAAAASYETFTPITFTTTPQPPTPAPAPATPTIGTQWDKKPTAGKKGKLTLNVGAAGIAGSGRAVVKVRNAKGKVVKKLTTQVVDGVASVRIPKLRAGTYKVVVAYGGDGRLAAGTSTTKVKVKRR